MKIDFLVEKQLKYALSEGDQKALSVLMDLFYQPLCTYVNSLSNDYELSQDIVQSIFINLWEDREKIHSIKSLKSYLYTSVYNRLTNEWRKNKRMLAIEEKHLSLLNDIALKEDEDVLQRQIKLIKLEIQKLPPKCKEIFLLSKQGGLTNIEIADYLDISKRTVETQMSKAYKLLRERLRDKIRPILFMLMGLNPNSSLKGGLAMG
ncbi:sigma-70 family RNA polymerase sigma factor [Muricauda sp. SCSIO 64092]|uniref:RNA polymerase sigma factor n=1 Tax=Allomuricauda sp. SCSIO 64092 TaxID=2908842 RepID=UPI001FF6B296|nr:sigma-70 family RNA polymerase sigma factor [Muricauda sp. SCSIO 64092]UOY04930.1 sigma-70 family RNA polymerase sigma factor [Muricauda sp. SCSIO 64092]